LFLDPPVVRVILKPGAWVDPSRMTQAIRDAGFTPVPEDVRFTMTGALESRQGRVVLVLEGMATAREVDCVEPADRGASDSRLAGHAGQRVELKGRWLFPDGGRFEVESIAPLDTGP